MNFVGKKNQEFAFVQKKKKEFRSELKAFFFRRIYKRDQFQIASNLKFGLSSNKKLGKTLYKLGG